MAIKETKSIKVTLDAHSAICDSYGPSGLDKTTYASDLIIAGAPNHPAEVQAVMDAFRKMDPSLKALLLNQVHQRDRAALTKAILKRLK